MFVLLYWYKYIYIYTLDSDHHQKSVIQFLKQSNLLLLFEAEDSECLKKSMLVTVKKSNIKDIKETFFTQVNNETNSQETWHFMSFIQFYEKNKDRYWKQFQREKKKLLQLKRLLKDLSVKEHSQFINSIYYNVKNMKQTMKK